MSVQEDHVHAQKTARSAAGALGVCSPVKEVVLSGEGTGKKPITITGGATPCQTRCHRGDGSSIHPFRPSSLANHSPEGSASVPVDDQHGRSTSAHIPQFREVTDSDSICNLSVAKGIDENGEEAMTVVMGVLEEMYTEEPSGAGASVDGNKHHVAIPCMSQCSIHTRSSTPDCWSERCDRIMAEATLSRFGGSDQGEEASAVPAAPDACAAAVWSQNSDTLNPAAAPFVSCIVSSAADDPPVRRGGSPADWQRGVHSVSEARWDVCDGRRSGRRCGVTDGRSMARSAPAIRAREDFGSMSQSSWRKNSGRLNYAVTCNGRPLSQCIADPHHAMDREQQNVTKSGSQVPAVVPIRTEAAMVGKASKKKKTKKKRQAKKLQEVQDLSPGQMPKIAWRASGDTGAVVAEASAASLSLTRGVGKVGAVAEEQTTSSMILARGSSKMGAVVAEAEAASLSLTRGDVQNGCHSPLTGPTHMKPASIKREKSFLLGLGKTQCGPWSAARRSQGMPSPLQTCAVTSACGPDTLALDSCAKANNEEDRDHSFSTALAPVLQNTVSKGFISMDDLCAWERRRQRADADGATRSTSEGSTASRWLPGAAAPRRSHSTLGAPAGRDDVQPSVSGSPDRGSAEGQELRTLGGGIWRESAGAAHSRPSPVQQAPSASKDAEQVGSWTPWGATLPLALPEMQSRRSCNETETNAEASRRLPSQSSRKPRASRSDVGAAECGGLSLLREKSTVRKDAPCLLQLNEDVNDVHGPAGDGWGGGHEAAGVRVLQCGSHGCEEDGGRNEVASRVDNDRFADAEEPDGDKAMACRAVVHGTEGAQSTGCSEGARAAMAAVRGGLEHAHMLMMQLGDV